MESVCQCENTSLSIKWCSCSAWINITSALSAGRKYCHGVILKAVRMPSGAIRMPSWISRPVGYTAVRMVSEATKSCRMPTWAMVMLSGRRREAVTLYIAVMMSTLKDALLQQNVCSLCSDLHIGWRHLHGFWRLLTAFSMSITAVRRGWMDHAKAKKWSTASKHPHLQT